MVISNLSDLSYPIYVTLYGLKGKVKTKTLKMRPNSYAGWDNFLEGFFEYRGTGAVRFDAWFDPPGGSSDNEFAITAEVYTDSPNGRYSTLVDDGEGAEDISLGYTRVVDEGRIIANRGLT